MENYYYMLIIALGALAILDLVVGVSNDAVNFLNSAIGSKAVSMRTILIVASIGIVLGAISSSGMMEVARSGIFVPGKFYFSEIMIIFMAVMLTDIILLDIFNTVGLPTSTTVSIVFELLGAAVAMALIKISADSQLNYSNVIDFINQAIVCSNCFYHWCFSSIYYASIFDFQLRKKTKLLCRHFCRFIVNFNHLFYRFKKF